MREANEEHPRIADADHVPASGLVNQESVAVTICKSTHKKGEQMSNSIMPMRIVRGMFQSLCIVMLLLICRPLPAQNEEPRRVRNIVLVHGAWADGSGWKGVYEILVKNGFNVSSVQEPETSFQAVHVRDCSAGSRRC
jgi:hypothetical protein